MTQTLEAQADLTPQQRVDTWLADFEAALAARDIDRVVGKFATDSGLYYDLRDVSKSLKELLDEIKKHPGKVGVTVKLF